MALRNIDDLFDIAPCVTLDSRTGVDRLPARSFWSTFSIYELALVIVCPILLLFAHRCAILAKRSATFRLLASHKWPIPRGTAIGDKLVKVELVQDHIGRPIVVRFIPAVPMRRIDLWRDARRECPMTTRAGLLFAGTTVNTMPRNLGCERW